MKQDRNGKVAIVQMEEMQILTRNDADVPNHDAIKHRKRKIGQKWKRCIIQNGKNVNVQIDAMQKQNRIEVGKLQTKKSARCKYTRG